MVSFFLLRIQFSNKARVLSRENLILACLLLKFENNKIYEEKEILSNKFSMDSMLQC